MKKIIAAFDSLHFSEATSQYAIQVARQNNAHLVGVFLDDRSYAGYRMPEMIITQKQGSQQAKFSGAAVAEAPMQAAEEFELACQKGKVEYNIHHDHKLAVRELQHESIYADLLVINSRETMGDESGKHPSRFIRELLGELHCPVLLVPQKYTAFQHVVLLYDAEPACMHAIKLFSYLMPQLKHLTIELLAVNPENDTLHIHDNRLIKEYMKRHYPEAQFTALKGIAEAEIERYLSKQGDGTLVVMGAHRRGAFSRWVWVSMSDILLDETALPLFISYYG